MALFGVVTDLIIYMLDCNFPPLRIMEGEAFKAFGLLLAPTWHVLELSCSNYVQLSTVVSPPRSNIGIQISRVKLISEELNDISNLKFNISQMAQKNLTVVKFGRGKYYCWQWEIHSELLQIKVKYQVLLWRQLNVWVHMMNLSQIVLSFFKFDVVLISLCQCPICNPTRW